MGLLYKYLDPGGIEALKSMSLRASDPASFNDPFEIRPWFDQERHDFFVQSLERYYASMGIKRSLVDKGTLLGMPTESAIGFSEQIHERFRNDLSRRFRVLCLTQDDSSVLMWGHYAAKHKGLVLGLDTSVDGFPCGLRSGGFPVEYPTDRQGTKLPVAYYKGVSVEQYDFNGRVVNDPNEEVECAGGIVIPFSAYHRQVEAATLSLLTTKATGWKYEKEVRFVYDLPVHSSRLKRADNDWYVPIPPSALREIVFGLRASPSMVETAIDLFKTGSLGQPTLCFAICHPNLYAVQKRAAKAEYLISYYRSPR